VQAGFNEEQALRIVISVVSRPAAEGRRLMGAPEQTRGCYVGSPALFLLSQACMVIAEGLGTPYLVGSALQHRNFRDVDVRVILLDDDFYQRFPGARGKPPMLDPLWSLLSSSVSVWLQQASGLPVDFQVQSQTQADRYPGARYPLGIYPHVFATAGG
jgi:hypothetical protein